MEEKNIEVIKNTVSEMLEKMGFSGQVEISKNLCKETLLRNSKEEETENNLACNINIEEDSNFLIGQYGINLQALQHIARLIVRKKIEERANFILDVNYYRQQKDGAVIEQAKLAATQAVDEKKAVVMKPMSAYERRIVHVILGEDSRVVTESIGEGEDRKVMIRPVQNL